MGIGCFENFIVCPVVFRNVLKGNDVCDHIAGALHVHATVVKLVKYRNGFGASDVVVRAERAVGITGNASVGVGLVNGRFGPVALHIGEGCHAGVRLVDGFDHLRKFCTGDLAIGAEGAIGIALHVAGVNDCIDGSVVPTAADVDEVGSCAVGKIQTLQATDNGCRFGTGHVAFGLEGAIFVAVDIQLVNGSFMFRLFVGLRRRRGDEPVAAVAASVDALGAINESTTARVNGRCRDRGTRLQAIGRNGDCTGSWIHLNRGISVGGKFPIAVVIFRQDEFSRRALGVRVINYNLIRILRRRNADTAVRVRFDFRSGSSTNRLCRS